jgi:chaperone modulatory protein CbpM
MDEEHFIPIDRICERYEIEVSFIRELADVGLVQIVHETSGDCVDTEALADLERLIRLHYDLEINFAGLEAIHHLLERMKEMQKEVYRLRNRLGES